MNIADQETFYRQKIRQIEKKMVNRNIASELITTKCYEMLNAGRITALSGYINTCIIKYGLDRELKRKGKDAAKKTREVKRF